MIFFFFLLILFQVKKYFQLILYYIPSNFIAILVYKLYTEHKNVHYKWALKDLFFSLTVQLGGIHKLRQVFFEDFRPPLPPLSDKVRFGGPPLNNDVIFESPPPHLIRICHVPSISCGCSFSISFEKFNCGLFHYIY